MTARFVVDEPAPGSIGRVTRVSGWAIGRASESDLGELELRLDGQPWAGLRGGQLRPDVQRAHSQEPGALRSGFSGDLLLPLSAKPGEVAVLEIAERGASRTLHQARHPVAEPSASPPLVQPVLEEILRCPESGGRLAFDAGSARPLGGRGSHPIRAGVPYLLDPAAALPCVRLSEPGETNPYGEHTREILAQHPEGLVLDFGAGNPGDKRRPGVVRLDVQHFRGTDVVCTHARLPFPDSVFDAVVSQAVFEHLPDPAATARELARVLRPGGTIYVETAFLQPLHADPSHYFNMTASGLRAVMAPFEPVEEGVRAHQFPSFALRMQLDEVSHDVEEGVWRERIEALRSLLDREGDALDSAIGDRGRRVLAGGVYFLGRKP